MPKRFCMDGPSHDSLGRINLQIACCIPNLFMLHRFACFLRKCSDEGSCTNGHSAMSMSEPPGDDHQPHIVLMAGRCFVWDVVSDCVPAHEPFSKTQQNSSGWPAHSFHTQTFTGYSSLAARSSSHHWYLRWPPKTWNKSSTHDADVAAG
jgi:hypothetical protein